MMRWTINYGTTCAAVLAVLVLAVPTGYSTTFPPSHSNPYITANTGLTLDEGTSDTITSSHLRADDAEQGPANLTFAISTITSHGTLKLNDNLLDSNGDFTQEDINNGSVTYTHDGGATTVDEFTFSVYDGDFGYTDLLSFVITVTPVNDDPVIDVNRAMAVDAGSVAMITRDWLSASDTEQSENQLTFTLGTAPAQGSLKYSSTTLAAGDTFTQYQLNSGNISYTHEGGAATTDSFTFTVADGAGGSAGGTFDITVTDTGRIGLGTLDGANGFTLEGDEYFTGITVGGAGDVNGDGYDDILVATPLASDYQGEVYLVYGSGSAFNNAMDPGSLDGSNGFVIAGAEMGEGLGFSANGAGDMNNDGYDDIVIGAPGSVLEEMGVSDSQVDRTYVMFGGPNGIKGWSQAAARFELASLGADNGFVMTGAYPDRGFGFSTAGAGDVNNDGYDDIIISSPGSELFSENNDPGFVYVVYGGEFGVKTWTAAAASLDLSVMDGTFGYTINVTGGDLNSGYSVAGAGDVNNDGYGDIIIGMPEINQGFSAYNSGGAAMVVLGGEHGVKGVPAPLGLFEDFPAGSYFVMDSENEGLFGCGVSGAGDLNDDSYDDMIVTAFLGSSSSYDSTRAYVVFGGQYGIKDVQEGFEGLTLDELDGTIGFTMVSGTSEGYFYLGYFSFVFGPQFTSAAGDVNGDGIDDVAIGWPMATYVSNDEQNIHVYSHGETWVVYGKESGWDALIGGPDLDGDTGIRLIGEDLLANSGSSISGVGDVNDDGYSDLVIGTPFIKDMYGEASLVLGAADLGTEANRHPTGITIETTSLGENLPAGTPVGTLVAEDPDGGETFTYYLSSSILVNLELGSPPFMVDDGVLKTTEALDYETMSSYELVVLVRDSGGLTDIEMVPITVTDSNDAPSNILLEHLSYSPDDFSTLDGSTGFALNGIDNYDYSGCSVRGAGDVNNDGFDDVIIGARDADPDGKNGAGETYLVFGGLLGVKGLTTKSDTIELSTLDGINGLRLDGINQGDNSGGSVSGAGDVNGDGYDDVVIGARWADPNGRVQAGETYLVFGGQYGVLGMTVETESFDLAGIDGSNGVRLQGIDENDYSGHRVSGAGDVNGDGYGDIMIMATEADINPSGDEGELYLVFGGPYGVLGMTVETASFDLSTLDGANGCTLFDSTSEDGYDTTISGAGDVNDDGYDDMLIGYPEAGANRGKVYLYYGRASGWQSSVDLDSIDTADGCVITGGNTFGLGLDIRSAGDINGDGYGDIVMCDYAYPDLPPLFLFYTWYVVYGGEHGVKGWAAPTADLDLDTLDGTAGFKIESSEIYDELSCSGAGDVDGDGYGDLLLGSKNYPDNPGMTTSIESTGRVFVILGGEHGIKGWTSPAGTFDAATLDGDNGYTLDGIYSYDYAGSSLSGAGDMNADGLADIIVGAEYADPDGRDQAGQSYVVLGRRKFLQPVTENQPAGQVVDTFDVVDQDSGHELENQILELVAGEGDTHNGYFEIVTDGGEVSLVTTTPLDYELNEVYSIRVRSTDPMGATVEEVFSIVLANVPEITSIQAVNDTGDGHPERVVITFDDELRDGDEDVSDWRLVDADGVTDLLEGLTDNDVTVDGNTVTFTLPGTTGTTGTPYYAYYDDAAGGRIRNELGDLLADVVTPLNHLPLTIDIQNQTSVPAVITLDASAATDADGHTVSYTWWQDDGPVWITFLEDGGQTQPKSGSVSPRGAAPSSNGAVASFIARKDGVYTFVLEVDDSLDTGFEDTVQVTILNVAPRAKPGRNRSVIGSTVEVMDITLSGAASTDANDVPFSDLWDPDRDIAGYKWKWIDGPEAVTLDPANGESVEVSFSTYDLDGGIYTFELDVTDEDGLTGEATVTVTVNVADANVIPTADAGRDLQVETDVEMTLSGHESKDSDGEITDFIWEQVSGTAVSLVGATVERTFTPTEDGTYVFSLTVTDDQGDNSSPDLVEITVIDRQVEFPGVQISYLGEPVLPGDAPIPGIVAETLILQGAAVGVRSFSGVTIEWSQPYGTPVTFADANAATFNFTPIAEGIYRFKLDVEKDGLAGRPAEVTVTVVGDKNPPLATAGDDQTVMSGEAVALDGTGSSDADAGDTLEYTWTQLRGPNVPLSDPETAGPGFTPVKTGVYTFQLVVFDGTFESLPDTVHITVNSPAEHVPVAETTEDEYEGNVGAQVTLNGSPSHDDDDDELEYYWSQLAGPPVLLSNPYSATPVFYPRYTGVYVFELVVDDRPTNTGDQSVGTQVKVTVGDMTPGSTETGCFIATAAYGTPFDRDIDALRSFRDRYLLPTAPGREMVELYYRWSPPAAAVIGRDADLRRLVRNVLSPVVRLLGISQ